MTNSILTTSVCHGWLFSDFRRGKKRTRSSMNSSSPPKTLQNETRICDRRKQAQDTISKFHPIKYGRANIHSPIRHPRWIIQICSSSDCVVEPMNRTLSICADVPHSVANFGHKHAITLTTYHQIRRRLHGSVVEIIIIKQCGVQYLDTLHKFGCVVHVMRLGPIIRGFHR